MMDRKYLWLAVICTCVLAAGAPATVIISDAFAGHANGASLKGTVTDAAGATTTATWNGGSSGGAGFTFATGDYVQSATSNRVNHVPYSPATGDIYTVSADMNFVAGARGILGFDYANGSFPQAGGNAYGLLLFVELYDNGNWWLKYKNTSNANVTSGISGTITGLTAGTFYPVTLQWDPTTKTANVWINNSQVLTDKVVSAINTNPVAFAGFGCDASYNLKVDNFAVSTVPDPATLALLFSGAGLAWLRRRS